MNAASLSASFFPAFVKLTAAISIVPLLSTAGNKKEVKVALPTYTSVGVYSYIITEKTGTTAGV